MWGSQVPVQNLLTNRNPSCGQHPCWQQGMKPLSHTNLVSVALVSILSYSVYVTSLTLGMCHMSVISNKELLIIAIDKLCAVLINQHGQDCGDGSHCFKDLRMLIVQRIILIVN